MRSLLTPLLAATFGLLVAFAAPSARAGDVQLVMVEEAGCMWCARWNAEIAEAYPKTPEGRAAPLRRIDIHGDRPEDLAFSRPVTFTPTFVLVEDGVEVARIEGYPGEDFFWGLLEMHLKEQTGYEGAS